MTPEEENDVEAFIDYLISEGALEYIGIDHNDEPIYTVTKKCKEVLPELYDEHIQKTDDAAFSLWQKGLVEIEFTDDDHLVSLTPDSAELYLEHRGSLSSDEMEVLFVLAHSNKNKEDKNEN
jgi:hypothetical protein